MRIGGKKTEGISVKLVHSDQSFEQLKLVFSEFKQLVERLDDNWEIYPYYYLGGKGYPLPSTLELPNGSFVIIKEDE